MKGAAAVRDGEKPWLRVSSEIREAVSNSHFET